jgi:hypothetical protein
MHQIFFRDCSSFQKGSGPLVRTWNRCVCLLTRFIFFVNGCRFRQSVRKLGCRRCERTAMLFYPRTLRKDTDLMSRNQILTLNSIGRILCSFTHFVYWTWWPWQSTGTFCKSICTPLFRAHPTEPFGKRVEFYVTLRSIIYDRLDFWIALAPCVAMLWGLHLLDLHLTTGALTSAFQWCCIENKFSWVRQLLTNCQLCPA